MIASLADTEFRGEVREFVKAALPEDIRRRSLSGVLLDKYDYVRWQKLLYQKGWFAMSWPREHGGAGWPVRRQKIFIEETVLNGAPAINPFGVNMVGPVLYTFGTPHQQKAYLPGILKSDIWWCQGYSEPNAGSDLASLTTTAVREGDDYIVNGTKMWTTDAQWADMMHCLVRTDKTGRKQQGISFLLIDMRSAGITIKPIVMLDGVRHVNQVFFDAVKVPIANRIGAEGEGWAIAKFLLSHERAFIDRHQSRMLMLQHIRKAVMRITQTPAPAADLDSLLIRVVEAEARMISLSALEQKYIDSWESGHDAPLGPSVLKVRGTEQLQEMAELWRDLQGPYSTCYDVRDVETGSGLFSSEPWVAAAPVNYLYLFSRCHTIFGGSNEIQRNIIARQLLAC